VDDDQYVLDGLSASLRRMRNKWSMEFLCGGPSALLRLASGDLDAVVTDMRMPGTDGETVLTFARQRWPGALRIILSGQTERAVVLRTVGVAHQFLSKPCSADEVRDCLQRQLDLSSPLDQPTRDLVLGVGSLPVSPRALSRLLALRQGAALGSAEIASCIEQDAALTAKVIHVASAGFYAERQSVSSVEAAVNVLGAETIFAIVPILETFPMDWRRERLFRRSLATGQLLRRMAEGEEARLCAALHGLGKVVLLAKFGSEYLELLERMEAEPGLCLAELERRRFGMSHDLVGAHLLGMWGGPVNVVDALRAQADPELAAGGTRLTLALHVACALTQPGAQIDEGLLAHPLLIERLPTLRAWLVEIEAQAPCGTMASFGGDAP
jgi:HD-like signal output (HDOD) protein